MATVTQYVITFIAAFLLTLYSSYIGDDDVIYHYIGRTPSPKEGICRIRFVFIKTMANLFGGISLGSVVGLYVLKNEFKAHLTFDEAVFLALACMGVVHIFIGMIQNLIRRTQERQQRPLVDFVVLKYNLQRWIGQ